MNKQMLHLGLALPGQNVESRYSFRMDLTPREEALDILKELVNVLYDDMEEGEADETNESTSLLVA
jgi:hypothetical protein